MRRLLAAVIAALLVAGTIGAFTVKRPHHGTVAARHSEALGPTSHPAGKLESSIPEIERFVEKARGLTFTTPVKVTVLDSDAFRRRLFKGAFDKKTLDRIATTGRVLTALELIPKGTDLLALERSLYGAAVLGLYDPKTKELLVRGVDPTPMVRTTLAHELTHALQDQHFGLNRDFGDDSEKDAAFQGLVEGDAVRIQRQYLESLSNEDQKEEEREEAEAGAAVPSDIPRSLVAFAQYPYLAGPSFVARLVQEGGQPRLDAAFKDPPVDTEQVLDPATFLAGQGPKAVDKPTAEGDVVDSGVFGEFDWLVILGLANIPGARAAAQGWGGDSYVAWRDGGKTCVRDAIVFDTPQDLTQFRTAADQWSGGRSGVTVTGSDPIVVTACG